VPVWILGSSLYGAQLAAHLGLPYAFASHFAPAALEDASEIYRQTFRPSVFLDKPHFMLAINLFAAPTDEEGHFIRTSMQLGFARLRTGKPGKLPRPVEDIDAAIDPMVRPMVDEALRITAVGSPESVKSQLAGFIAAHQPDEVILTGHIHDHRARLQSFRIGAEAMQALNGDAGAR
jgi:luciferase family oxidoreductase group 1